MPFVLRCSTPTPQPQLCQQWQGGSGSRIPPKTAAELDMEKDTAELTKRQLEASKKPVVAPVIPVPEPTPPLSPPPSTSSADVVNAARDAKRVAEGRRGVKWSLLSQNALGGQQSLLG